MADVTDAVIAPGTGRVLVLNGASSSGKTTMGRILQERLDGWWLLFGVDTLITAMPWKMFGDADGHTISGDGVIEVGRGWRRAHDHWRAAVATLVRCGSNVILDEVFLDGAGDQQRWRAALDGVEVTWVGVRCDPDVAAARERDRGDRAPNLARAQSTIVHQGVGYDVEVDTTATSSDEVASAVLAHLAPR